MRIAATLALAGAALAFAACAQGKKAAKKISGKDSEVITKVRMDRGACFGRCPVYAIEVGRDGTARYYGKMFTAHQGIWEKNIGAEKAAVLIQQYQAARVDTCKNDYDVPISDLPGLYYTFTYAKKASKQINNANFGPRFLSAYGKRIDEAVRVDNTWRKVADTVTN